MLYIYHVDVGHLFAFDMDLAMKRVRELKKEIEKVCGIPYINQVLVVSGGQIMDGKRVVGSYQAGTDNNPVWLVDNRIYNQNQAPVAYIPDGPDDKRLKEFLQNSMNLPPTYDTIVTRAQLSMRFHENGRDDYKICEILVKDQHFQHQGWAALKCTLEDKGTALEKNRNQFLKAYDQYLSERLTAINQLQQYENTRKLIRKIPIPKCLDHYAKKCTDRLMKDSAALSTAERKISNFVSLVDKLDKSEYSSGSNPPSGPSSGQFHGMYDSSETQKAPEAMSGVVERSSPVVIRRKNGDRGSAHSSSDSLADKGSFGSNSSSGVRIKTSSLTDRDDAPLSGFTSPGIQSPCATPKKLSHIQEEEDNGAYSRDPHIETTGKAEDSIRGRAIKFEISPSVSQTSSQSSMHDSRSLSPSPCRRKTLSDWIRGNDSKDPIDMVKKELDEKFSKLTPEKREELIHKCNDSLKALNNRSMKEFKGLDRRLAGLEQLMMQMKDLVRQQSDMAQGFIQNQQRARTERDVSVLPDLCVSHRKQLQVMIENHQRLCDIKRRITNAKQELCTVLHARIRWIMHMEEKLREVDNDIVMTQGMLRRLFSYMKTLNQVHETPALFAEAVVEGYRRRRFAFRFMEWADSWALENRNLYEKELERRKEFNMHFSGHFLLRMFTGYGEEPPSFATKMPEPFDMELPAITLEDVDMLRQEVPEIAHWLNIPEDIDIGRLVATHPLRVTSSLALLPSERKRYSADMTSSSSAPIAHPIGVSPPPATANQATSYCLAESPADDNSSDIVVLNANGEQGVLTPSPEHRAKLPATDAATSVSNLVKSSHSPLYLRDMATSPDIGLTEGNSLTQSVEVILTTDADMGDAASQHHGFTLPFAAYEGDSLVGKPLDQRSISVQEPRSIDASPPDTELAFHSLRSLSLDDVRDLKSTPIGTSPDLDDFATADFYIEESIPSAMSASSPDKTITELQLQLEEKCSQIVEKDGELQKLKDKNAESKAQVEKLNEAISILLRGLESRGADVSTVRQQLNTIRSDSVQLRDQLQTDVEQCSRTIIEQLQLISQENLRVAEENKQLREELDILKKQNEDREKELEAKMDESVCVISEEWEQKLKSANEEITQEKQKHYDMISDLTAQLALQQEKLISMQKTHDGKVETLTKDHQHQVVTMQETNSEEISVLQRELQAQQDKYQSLQAEKQEMAEKLGVESEKLQQTEGQIKVTSNEVDSLKQKVTELEKLKSQLQNDFGDLEKELSLKMDSEKELQESNSLLNNKVGHLTEQYEKQLNEEKEKLHRMEKDLEEQKKLLQEKSEEYENKCKTLLEENRNFELKLKEFKEEAEISLNTLKSESESELNETRSHLMLEHEVEMEKVRSDLEIEVSFKEQELDNIKEQLDSTQKQLQSITVEKDKIQENLQQQFQEEKNEIQQILEKENKEKLAKQEKELRDMLASEEAVRLDQALKEKEEEMMNLVKSSKEEVEQEYVAKIDEMKIQHLKELEDQYLQNEEKSDELKREMTDQYEGQREKERLQLSENKKEIMAAIESEKEKDMKELKESLAFDFHKRITGLRSDLEGKEQELEQLREAVKSSKIQLKQMKEDPNQVSLDRHDAIVEEMKAKLEEENQTSISQALEVARKQHQEEIEILIDKLERDKKDSLDQMKTSLTGDKQVVFNEALNKVATEKDRVIGELKEKLSATESQLQGAHLDVTRLRGELADAVTSAEQCKVSLCDAEHKDKENRSEIQALRQQIQSGSVMASMSQSLASSIMSQSVVPISEGSSLLQDKIVQLEMELKTKEQEIARLKDKLQEKMGELSISPATQSLVKDKISITSCSKGDVVLLCLDDKYDHYVVFTVGTTLHFLHSDCLETLNLKPVTGEQKRLWVLAEIVEKEYCQAKKAHNRFKVPMGTKFYRVRCKPWSHPSLTASAIGGQLQQKSPGSSGSNGSGKKRLAKSSAVPAVSTERQDSVEAVPVLQGAVGGNGARTADGAVGGNEARTAEESSSGEKSGNDTGDKTDTESSSGARSDNESGAKTENEASSGARLEEDVDREESSKSDKGRVVSGESDSMTQEETQTEEECTNNSANQDTAHNDKLEQR